MKSLRSYFYRFGAWVGCEMPPDLLLNIAAERGNNDKLTLALEAGANIHAFKDSALRSAEANGHAETVKLLTDWIEMHESKKASSPGMK